MKKTEQVIEIPQAVVGNVIAELAYKIWLDSGCPMTDEEDLKAFLQAGGYIPEEK